MLLTYSTFFFSSRRRHTRLVSDWSSDVCSSDLNSVPAPQPFAFGTEFHGPQVVQVAALGVQDLSEQALADHVEHRSEERRVGKECRPRWLRYDLKQKIKREKEFDDVGISLDEKA